MFIPKISTVDKTTAALVNGNILIEDNTATYNGIEVSFTISGKVLKVTSYKIGGVETTPAFYKSIHTYDTEVVGIAASLALSNGCKYIKVGRDEVFLGTNRAEVRKECLKNTGKVIAGSVVLGLAISAIATHFMEN